MLKLNRQWLFVLGLVIMVYLSKNFILPRVANGLISAYVIQPLTWALVAFIIIRMPRQRAAGKSSIQGNMVKFAACIAAFQIYLSVIAGLFDKFGKSPNSFTLKGIIINFIFVSTALTGTELTRAWLINRMCRKPAMFIPVMLAILYTAFELPATQLMFWGGTLENTTKTLGSTFLPLFSENLLASFLALWGGAVPALVYRGILQGFAWFSPVLPDLNWAMKALTGTVVPMVGLVLIQQYALFRTSPGKFRRESGKGMAGWVVMSVMAILAIWFSLGVFPVRPTVIISGSMRPNMEVGDISVVARTKTELLKVGDVIQFRVKDTPIPTVHRIIEVSKQGDKIIYRTQGDANDIPDSEPVLTEQVVGKVVFVVPKLGWGAIAVRKVFSSQG